MDTRIIERVLTNQKAELENFKTKGFCHRPEEDMIDMESGLAQVVIGVRRSGKSTLCINALEKSSVKYAYINFDDERLDGVTSIDLDDILEMLYKVYGDFTHLALDEIQNVEGWHLFVNRMLRQGLHVIITGSNSRLLSGELASHLTGRHHQIELFPFSFRDFCNYNNVALAPFTTKNRGLLAAAFDKYLEQGGLPELMKEKEKKEYVIDLTKSIIQQDIKKRFNVKYTDTLMHLVNHLLNEAPATIVKEKLQRLFKIKSAHTIGNYLSYLEQTYLISILRKYSQKSRVRVQSEKYYAIDVAFMSNRKDAFSGVNLGYRLETIVYIELKRRAARERQDVYYHATQDTECDFVVCQGNEAVAVYQVSYDISNPKTYKREINGCVSGIKATGCDNAYLLTYNDDRDVTTSDGYKIKIRPVWMWLAEEPRDY